MAVKFRISPAGFGWLSKAFPDKNGISPLKLFEKMAMEFSEEDKKDLIEQNVIEEDGTVKPEALAALKVLEKAGEYSRIRILGVTAPVDKVTYFKDNLSCSVDSSGDKFLVSFPPLVEEALFAFEEFTGSSKFINVPFYKKLSSKGAVLFFTILDLTRFASLSMLIEKPEKMIFDKENIQEKALKPENSPMYFISILKDLIGETNLTESDIEAALEELKDNGLIEEKENGFALINEARELALNFLLPEYIFSIEYGKMISDDSCEHSECRVIFCGIHNLMYIDTEGEKVIIETMSGDDLLNLIANALNKVD